MNRKVLRSARTGPAVESLKKTAVDHERDECGIRRLGSEESRSDRSRDNPCPCGFWNDPTRECRCSPMQMQRYVGRISGPLLDRIDIHVDVPAVKFRELRGEAPPETDSSTTIRQRVIKARERQHQRFASEKIFSNAVMTPRMIRAHCQNDAHSEKMLENA